jgi:hypothetical protein
MNPEGGKREGAGHGARGLAMVGVLTAMTAAATALVHIPTPLPQGYFNLGDAVVLVTAALLGPRAGAFAGGLGSALADVLLGGYLFAPITLVAKGLEGFAAGALCGGGALAPPGGAGTAQGGGPLREGRAGRVTGPLCAGAAVMVAGYFVAEATVLRLMDNAFGLSAAFAELPLNALQGALSVALARFVLAGLKGAGLIARQR